MTQSKGYRNPLVGRISQLLDYLAHNEATLQTIVRDMSTPKTSAYVLLQSLLDVAMCVCCRRARPMRSASSSMRSG